MSVRLKALEAENAKLKDLLSLARGITEATKVRAELSSAALEEQLAEIDTHRRKILAENERLLNAVIEKNRILSTLEREESFEKMAEAASREYMHIFGKHLLIKHARLILTAALEGSHERRA